MMAIWDEERKSWYVKIYHGVLRYTPGKEQDNLWLHAEAHSYDDDRDAVRKTMKKCLDEIGVAGEITSCHKDSVYWYATFKEGAVDTPYIEDKQLLAEMRVMWRKYAKKHKRYADAEIYFEDYVQCWSADGIKLGNTIEAAYALLKSETAK